MADTSTLRPGRVMTQRSTHGFGATARREALLVFAECFDGANEDVFMNPNISLGFSWDVY